MYYLFLPCGTVISALGKITRKEMGPEGPKDTRPDVLFTWALRGQWKAKAVNWLQTFL